MTENLISVFPNPSVKSINLKNTKNAPLNITIENLNGQIVYQQIIYENASISIPTTPGMYIVKAIEGQLVQIERIIVQ